MGSTKWRRILSGTGLFARLALGVLVAAPFLCGGCASQRTTETKRTATEQLLISTAADRALDEVDVSSIAGRKVWLNTLYLEAVDEEYVIGSIRDLLISNGVVLLNDEKDAEVVIEARSGALSIDSGDSLTGLPAMPVPIPFAGTVETPEVALYKTQKQESIAKFALLAYERESKDHVFSQRDLVGTAYNTFYQVLGIIRFRRTDLPEKKMLHKWRENRSSTGRAREAESAE